SAPASVSHGASSIVVATAASVGQAAAITLLGTGTSYNLADQIGLLTAPTADAARAANGATNITVIANPTTGIVVNAAQATIIDAYTNTGTNDYILIDSAANLAAAPASVISGGTTVIASGFSTVAQA